MKGFPFAYYGKTGYNGVMDELSALKEAVRIVGGQAALGRLCIDRDTGKPSTQAAVFYWLTEKGRLPADYVLAIEEATGVSRHDLRPDIYPRESAGEAA
jgi:DNA-binding transcriptional regulator YdaS (Cro superfamily)